MDREVVFLLQDPCPDGGYFENFADLVGKYGVVPKEVMAETASSEEHGDDEPHAALGPATPRAELREIYRQTGSVKQCGRPRRR